ncbi:hypothetical protein PCANC_14568 [Puccinia coronata f. sp. avenae]|uniref:Uncharacterized protein n=1 Tax=Puccinia coronata f. sp. avenae TaxID=200324 RepID=A0A2N5S4X2_9BASI|nr:hypothetical protein PCANC_26370 [Puccinia coronata f. sp. avenae]PLW38054.1 hypothetical protein PCANC_14568 [Puccinia coronata f. sp. avenae]
MDLELDDSPDVGAEDPGSSCDTTGTPEYCRRAASGRRGGGIIIITSQSGDDLEDRSSRARGLCPATSISPRAKKRIAHPTL